MLYREQKKMKEGILIHLPRASGGPMDTRHCSSFILGHIRNQVDNPVLYNICYNGLTVKISTVSYILLKRDKSCGWSGEKKHSQGSLHEKVYISADTHRKKGLTSIDNRINDAEMS